MPFKTSASPDNERITIDENGQLTVVTDESSITEGVNGLQVSKPSAIKLAKFDQDINYTKSTSNKNFSYTDSVDSKWTFEAYHDGGYDYGDMDFDIQVRDSTSTSGREFYGRVDFTDYRSPHIVLRRQIDVTGISTVEFDIWWNHDTEVDYGSSLNISVGGNNLFSDQSNGVGSFENPSTVEIDVRSLTGTQQLKIDLKATENGATDSEGAYARMAVQEAIKAQKPVKTETDY